jgi:hypothetical protein
MKRRALRPLQLEACEQRAMMAGDVSVALEGSLLKVQGDNLSNQIGIVQQANGNVVVSGLTGTRINGSPFPLTLINPQLNSLEVAMKGGDDAISIGDLRVGNDLMIDLGAGNDTATLDRVFAGATAEIKGEQGTDRATVRGSIFGNDLFIDQGIGASVTQLAGVRVGMNATVITDAANDVVNATDLILGGDLSIETKAGADSVVLTRVQANKLSLNTDEGADLITMSDSQTRDDVIIESGKGNDGVTLQNVRSQKSLTVKLDDGNDTLVATNVTAAIDAVFDGGAGIDLFDNNGVSGGVKLEIVGFERFV